MFASIPSPSSSTFELGPLTFRAYGLMIAFGVLAAVWLAGKRFAERGYKLDHASGLAMWVVPAGLVGARLYHVATDWRSFQGRWFDIVKIWEGGLGILGGVIAGLIAGAAYARKHDLPVAMVADVAAPALPLGQAIGRWGNWFNQELFGKATDVPWALEIDPENLPAGYEEGTTFHPTFLYESIWNLALVGVLLRIERTKRIKPGGLFAAYLAGYSAGRLWIEALRIDHASQVGGLRINLWVFSVVLIVSLTVLVKSLRSREEMELLRAESGSDEDATDADSDVDSDVDLGEAESDHLADVD